MEHILSRTLEALKQIDKIKVVNPVRGRQRLSSTVKLATLALGLLTLATVPKPSNAEEIITSQDNKLAKVVCLAENQSASLTFTKRTSSFTVEGVNSSVDGLAVPYVTYGVVIGNRERGEMFLERMGTEEEDGTVRIMSNLADARRQGKEIVSFNPNSGYHFSPGILGGVMILEGPWLNRENAPSALASACITSPNWYVSPYYSQ